MLIPYLPSERCVRRRAGTGNSSLHPEDCRGALGTAATCWPTMRQLCTSHSLPCACETKKQPRISGRTVGKVLRSKWKDARENRQNSGLQIDACCMQGWVGCLYGAGGMPPVAELEDHIGKPALILLWWWLQRAL